MAPPPTSHRFQLWTPSQQKGLLVLCVVLLGFLTVEFFRKPVLISDPPPGESPRAAEIQDRLDPNTADAAALSAIPNLGETRAGKIVEYREAFVRAHPGIVAFRSIEDLEQVKGIGAQTAANLKDYLMFPDTRDGLQNSSFSGRPAGALVDPRKASLRDSR